MFLMTDAQVPEERFLVLINDLLASGEVPDLFPDDELENIINGVANDVKQSGLIVSDLCSKYPVGEFNDQLLYYSFILESV